MTGFDYFSKCLSKYAVFKGRASRKEFWYFILFYTLMQMSLILFSAINGSEELFVVLTSIFSMVMFLPMISVGARRLHDMGQSAWLLLLGLLPPGMIALMVMFMMKSKPHSNKWGRSPDSYLDDEWDDDDEVLEDFEYRQTQGRGKGGYV